MKKLLLVVLMAGMVCSAQSKENDGWVSLFNGRNLKGWTKMNGKAEYKVKDGAIVGISTLNTPNTFLVTKERYGDFILELEYKVEDGLNSGIQFRSQSKPDYKDGRFHGYQCEIDPSDRAWSGGIYDEGRRGWLYDLKNEPEAQKAFKHNDWNKVRIEAVGTSLRIWLNGVPTADLIDDADAEGHIALQVHGIGNNAELAGKTISWKNIRIKTDNIASELTPESNAIAQKNNIHNTISKREAAQGWKLLWNGKDMTGWKSLSPRGNMAKGWKAVDGVLVLTAKSGAGDIITEKKYHSFELSIDFQLTPGANGGIKYFISENGSVGCEFQVLDDDKHPDAKAGFNNNRRLGSLYDLIPGGGWQYVNKYGWNTARIVVKGNHVEHWVNGKKLLEYEKGNDMWNTIVSHSKFAKTKNFAGGDGGHILLQDHYDEVHYRNIKIREL